MNLLPIVGVLACSLVVHGYLPEFDDPVHGRLIVSLLNPPFLTSKAHPNAAFYFPTDQQVAQIRREVYAGQSYRFKRDTGNITIGAAKKRLKRGILSADDFSQPTERLNLQPSDFEEGIETLKVYSKGVGKMIKSMFRGYLDQPDKAVPDLPFTSSGEKAYYKATVVPIESLGIFMEDQQDALALHAPERPNFPIDKALSEIRACRTVGFSRMTDKDFTFKSDFGGGMYYYRVDCMRIKNNMFVFFALSDNSFTLDTEEVEHVKTCTVYERQCFFWCFLSTYSPKFYKCQEKTTRSRILTAAQQKELIEFFIDKVIRVIKVDFADMIAAADDHRFRF